MTAYVRRRLIAFCAVGALVLTGCSESLPQTEAAPQPSTQEESPTPDSEPIPKFDVPEYTTDLDLTAEEMLAAEEALIGLQRYIFVSEQVMKSGGEHTLHIDSVTAEEANDDLKSTAKNFRDGGWRLTGQLVTDDFFIHEVDISSENAKTSAISACIPGERWGIDEDPNDGKDPSMRDEYRLVWDLQYKGSVWKVTTQELHEEQC